MKPLIQRVCEAGCPIAADRTARIGAEYLAGKWIGENRATLEALHHG